MQFCYDDLDCPTGQPCALPISPDAGYMLCAGETDACDPFTGTGCAAGNSCMVIPGTTAVHFCMPAGTARPGEDCSMSDCAVGAGCYMVDPAASPSCWKYCDLGGGLPDCSDVPGSSCQDALGDPSVGVCFTG
jgi:hypothetical protein